MFKEPLFILFLLNLRGTVLFASLRLLRGVIGFSGSMAISFCLSLYCFPKYNFSEILNRPVFSIVVEILLGLFCGLSLSFLFEFVPFLGRLVDTFRGVQFQEQVAPELGTRDSKLEIFLGFVVIAIFFQNKIFGVFVDLYLQIANKVGVGGFDGVSFIDTSLYFSDRRGVLIELLSSLFYSSLVVVSPLIVFSMIIELGFSIVLKLNSKFHLGTDLNLIRAYAGLVITPFIVCYSESLPLALIHLVEIGKSFLMHYI